MGKSILKNFLAAIRLKLVVAALGIAVAFAYTASTAWAAITWSGEVNPLDPNTWTSSTYGYIGMSSAGILEVNGGSGLLSSSGYLGYNSGSLGTATITGTGSKWRNIGDLFVGYSGGGNLNIEKGGRVSSSGFSTIGFRSGSTGTVTVTGAGSMWTNSRLYVGGSGSGTLAVADGGVVAITGTLFTPISALLGNGTITANGAVLDADLVFDNSHQLKQTIVFGTGGNLNLNQTAYEDLGVGFKGQGTLRIAEGMNVASTNGYLGYYSGATGTTTVTGTGSKWTNSRILYVGGFGSGSLNIEEGGQVETRIIVGAESGSTGTVKISGIDSRLTGYSSLTVGNSGSGLLRIEAGGQANNASSSSDIGFNPGATGTATVTGTGSKWTNSSLRIGYSGSGALNIEAGGQVISPYIVLGYLSGATGAATVTGAGSKWINIVDLYVGQSGSGKLMVSDGGEVTTRRLYASISDLFGNGTITTYGAVLDADLAFDSNHGTQQALSFGSGGTLNLILDGSESLGLGYHGQGTLRIADGITAASTDGYLGYRIGSTGIAMVTGNGSQWTNSNSLFIGYSGNGILNIGYGSESGGQVTAKTVKLAMTDAEGTCNINNGGTLRAQTIKKGSGTATFNWNDGTIRNYNADTNLTVTNGLVLKLAPTGSHSFNIDSERTGTVDAILSDATSGGTLKKIGDGTLVLTAANTYSGETVVDAGRFKVTGSILNTSGISVGESGILELAKSSGNATAANMPISNAGTILISAGSQKVGVITGTGITQVNAGTTLTAQSIIQNTLSIGGTGAGFADAADSSTIGQVPEPGTFALLGMGAFGLLAWAWRRRKA